jgi:hypothetical protein
MKTWEILRFTVDQRINFNGYSQNCVTLLFYFAINAYFIINNISMFSACFPFIIHHDKIINLPFKICQTVFSSIDLGLYVFYW